MSPLKKIAITTGDTDGIGLEVTVKGLAKVGPQKNAAFFYFSLAMSPKPIGL